MKRPLSAIAATGRVPVSADRDESDPSAGPRELNPCRAGDVAGKGGRDGAGPHLPDAVGRKARQRSEEAIGLREQNRPKS